jgi:hypothetical protein
MNVFMRRMLIGVCAFLMTAALTAAEPDSVIITGVVTDVSTNGLLEDVMVTASPDGFEGKSQTARTDVNGRFVITVLTPGRYVLSAPTEIR